MGRGCGCRKMDRLLQGAVSEAEACASVHVAKAQGSSGCGWTSSLFEGCCPMSEQRQALARWAWGFQEPEQCVEADQGPVWGWRVRVDEGPDGTLEPWGCHPLG